MALEFLRCVQKAPLSDGYDDIILKVKQVIYLESLYLKKDLVALLPTGYGKSLVFQVLPRLFREREETRATTSVTKSVVLVVSPLNALMYDQISKLRARGVEAAVLGVKKGIDADSPVISQWEGARESITQAGYEIVFCHPEAF
ncbi:ATP-dependent DNA helicase RecQ-like [Montipora capricornis]|uniref:ATP-dependent DNA helicase RecQ-like n=1 Tax=Montipora foliosa TaxID=591990 RepID=UPI0035F1F2C0